MRNLIDNALKYGYKNKPITITTFRKGENCVLIVSNWSDKLSNEDVEKIFEPF